MALPAQSPLPSLYKVGRGRLFLAPILNNAVAPGYVDAGNIKSAKFQIKDTRDKMVYMGDPYGLTSDTATVRREGEITIECTEYSQFNLAILTMGSSVPWTQTGASVSAEDLTTSLVLGEFYFTAHQNISALTDVKIGSTTLIAGVSGVGDYQVVDLVTGCIQINQVPSSTNAGIVVAGATVTTDYTYSTISAGTPQGNINIGAVAVVETAARFIAFNAKGILQPFQLWRVSWYPNDPLEFIAEKYGSFKLTGDVLADQAAVYGGSPTVPWGYIRNALVG